MSKKIGYVDTYIIPFPRAKLAWYKKWSKAMGTVCVDHGALSYVESITDDVPSGKVTSFAKSVKLKRGELIAIAVINYPSKSVRKQVNKKVMEDARLAPMMSDMPFDGMRMFWGGFKPIAQL